MRLRLLLAATLTVAPITALAADRAPTNLPELIDHHIDATIADAGVKPADQADDATMIRRLTLDLVGRIPTAAEVDAYVKSNDPNKRTKLVDQLIASPGFARHQARQFEAMLNPDGRNSGGLSNYLTDAIAANKPWDTMFRELMLPDQTDEKLKGAAEFLRSRVSDSDKLTSDVSVAFFGVNVSCAQCHNHPEVEDWKQDHFYGMKSFLDRTFDNGGFLAERGSGVIKFKPNRGAERTAKMMFLTGTVIEDADKELSDKDKKKEKQEFDKAKQAKRPPPEPEFSARAKLVEVSLQKENVSFFARNIANRMWHRYLGWGLVNPLDQLHSENPASHSELLAALTEFVIDNRYDLREVTRGIVMSKTYSRSSKYDSADRPSPRLFAVAKLKPMTPNQLATSLKIAATDPAEFEGKAEDVEKKLEQAESSARGFASLIAQPNDNFQISVGEAMLFSNGDRVLRDFLQDGNGTLIGRLKNDKLEPKAAVELMVKTVYGRPPTDAESDALSKYIEKRQDRLTDAYQQVLWALVTSPEFRFSY